MSAALVILPQVWATVEASNSINPVTAPKAPRRLSLVNPRDRVVKPVESPWSPPPDVKERGNFAFYRKYTEAMLRRCMKLSMGGGRVASLLGRELFQSNVSHCTVEAFDNSVIFVADIEACIGKLSPGQQYLVRRIGLQEYTLDETAAMGGLPLRTVIRRYNRALDDLTRMFLERNMLEREMSDAMRTVQNRR
jgi:Sigma-70, region 4